MAAQKEIIVLVHGFFRTRRDMAFAMGDRFVPLPVRRRGTLQRRGIPHDKSQDVRDCRNDASRRCKSVIVSGAGRRTAQGSDGSPLRVAGLMVWEPKR